MSSIPGYLSPRCDVTIRSVPPDKLEEIYNKVIDIIGGRVEFSTTAIYESQKTKDEDPVRPWALCPYLKKHVHHEWSTEKAEYVCPGRIMDASG